MPCAWALSRLSPADLCSASRRPGQNRSMKPQSPESFLTGSSKVATVRRRTPKTLKKSFQKDWRSAASRVSPCHSRLKAMARWRISFHDNGMGGGYHASPAKGQRFPIRKASEQGSIKLSSSALLDG